MTAVHPPTARPMAGRLAAGLALVAACVLLGGLLASVASLRDAEQRQARESLASFTRSQALQLQSRLEAAQAVVQAASAVEPFGGGAAIRQRLLHAEAVRAMVLLPPGASQSPVALGLTDQLALAAGQVLLRVRADQPLPALYLVRSVGTLGQPMLGWFELNRDWLWRVAEGGAGHPRLAVIDASGTLLFSTEPVEREQRELYAAERLTPLPAGGEPLARSWIAAGHEWRGAVAGLLPEESHVAADRWTVLAGSPVPPLSAAWAEAARPLPVLLIATALLVAFAAAYLRSAWELPLLALRRALEALGQGRREPVPEQGARDAPQLAVAAFNGALRSLAAREQASLALASIDRMLLESPDLESCLEPLLAKFCGIASCQGAMVALLDPDATDHGRAYVTGPGMHLPVSRISLDALLLSQLCHEPSGMTVARFEPGRHSLLEPLRERGADFFWLWPVLAQETLVGVLAVGYQGAPPGDMQVAGHGTECARRLSIAMTNSVRGEQLYRQAHFDALTGLPNRLLFRDRLQQELAGVTEGRGRGALLYVDLDHFKKVNDTVGHSAGDQVLQVVAQRLRTCVKEGDTVARLAGDEFAVVLRSVGHNDGAMRVASRIVEQLQAPVNIGGREHVVRASVGITLFPDDGTEHDELMRNADLAMYRAKESGRSRALFFDRAMQRMPALVAESGLYRALQRREFSLFYQPQYRLEDGCLSGLEALLRWQPPREAMRFPAEFVPAAEQSGLIVDIGAWVLEAACEQMARWLAEGIAPPVLSINLSVHQLRQVEFPRQVHRVLERVGLAPALVEFELTESVFVDEESRSALQRLAALGVRLAIDDFGTGYSSLGYLRQHPVQTIKIDRSFIEDVTRNETTATLAETIITMAHALGKTVVAEGVETMEQLVFLRERRCDIAQGYYFSRPVSATDVADLLRARLARAPVAARQAAG